MIPVEALETKGAQNSKHPQNAITQKLVWSVEVLLIFPPCKLLQQIGFYESQVIQRKIICSPERDFMPTPCHRP